MAPVPSLIVTASHTRYSVLRERAQMLVWETQVQQIIKSTRLAVKGALAHRQQRRTACKIQNGRQGAPKRLRGLERCLTLGFWTLPSTFALLLWGKVTWGKWKIMTFKVATNVVASQLPKCWPTGMPTACAKKALEMFRKKDHLPMLQSPIHPTKALHQTTSQLSTNQIF